MVKLKPILLSTVMALGATPLMAQEEQFITIGTGGQTGVYYVVGQSICRLVNRDTATTGLRCTAPATGGSIDNINQIKSGGMTMGVAQSDWQFHAYNGSSDYEGDAFTDLRAVFAVHPEPFTVVARADSGVETFTDLAGKRVNVGNPGSGSRGTFEVVLDAMGMSMDDFALSSDLRPAEQSAALGDNQVDAISYTVATTPAGCCRARRVTPSRRCARRAPTAGPWCRATTSSSSTSKRSRQTAARGCWPTPPPTRGAGRVSRPCAWPRAMSRSRRPAT